jgi:Domain of unknown function (DUF4210)/Chromosome segregation during meiosis
MPIFYGGGRDPASQAPRLDSPAPDEISRDGTPVQETRRSISPESGGITLTTTDGRPISRGEVIERLKRGESPTWTIKHNVSPPKQATPPRDIPKRSPPPTLMPSPEFTERETAEDQDRQNNAVGLEIERPRSALHSGDFRSERDGNASFEPLSSPLSVSPPAPWHSNFSSPFAGPRSFDSRPVSRLGASPLSKVFFLPPTSPLIHASSNPDLEAPFDMKNPTPESRRYSLSMHTFQSTRSVSGSPTPARSSGIYHPYQAHQPRRSISIPQTPRLRPRGISVSSEQSPLHHAPMVGSYEESILRGRMSTTPSKPLNFIAQIGVLGRGKCKPSLRCPPHASVHFPAVFYSYSSTGRSVDNQPSPYVGLIDIEHSFPISDLRSPPGGSYRIPQQGQLQIIIKNPNKTAVKLFLVPYDLSDMEPGQKTFIRQRSYSAGPIVDMPLTSNKPNEGAQESKQESSTPQSPIEKPTLRYLIHLNICCTAKGRYFLYKSIRVVFANRVPDGKEKLRNEIQLPEPKYSTYKPSREGVTSSPNSSLASALRAADKTARRRSTPFSFGINNLDQMDGIASPAKPEFSLNSPLNSQPEQKLEPIPFSLQQLDKSPLSEDAMDLDEPQQTRGRWVMDPNDGVELTNFDPDMEWMAIEAREKSL